MIGNATARTINIFSTFHGVSVFALLGALTFLIAIITVLVLPTSISEFACRQGSVCLSGAPRIDNVEPLGDTLYLVGLEGANLGPEVRAGRGMTMISTGEARSLVQSDELPVIGAYAPTTVASPTETAGIVSELVKLPSDRLLRLLDEMPGITNAGELTKKIAGQLATPKLGTTCEELAAAAHQFDIIERVGKSFDPTDKLELGLLQVAQSC